MNVSRNTGFDAAPQHGPRPLPLFLAMLRSETAADPAVAKRALAGLAAYQRAPRNPESTRLPVGHARGRVTLCDAGGSGRPVVFVPSLINPPSILDFAADRSLVRWMAARGHHAWLIDWGIPGAADRAMDLAAHVERALLPLIEALPMPPVLIGYCLGGTLAVAAAMSGCVAGVATIAAPWHFTGYGAEARGAIADRWAQAQPTAEAMGVVPMETLQAGFWQLDPTRTIAKYARFADLDPDGPEALAFIRLEDWANAGAPLPYAAGADLFDTFVAQDRPGHGTWRVAGHDVDPLALPCPAIEFVARADRIVPAATAVGWPDRRAVGAGHVGMIVGRSAQAQVWAPLADWIEALPPPR